jgi:hypothetical protein
MENLSQYPTVGELTTHRFKTDLATVIAGLSRPLPVASALHKAGILNIETMLTRFDATGK